MGAKVLSFASAKGGVGKSMTTCNTAVILAEKGFRVLAVDNDPQGNMSMQFNRYETTGTSLTDVYIDLSCSIKEVIKSTAYRNLDILSSNLSLATVSKILAKEDEIAQHNILKSKMEVIMDEYDYILIDSAPNLDFLTINALVASNEVITPLKIDRNAVEGLNYVLDMIQEIRDGYNPGLRHLGCLVTMYKAVKLDKMMIDQFSRHLNLFEAKIRDTVIARESTYGEPLVLYNRNSTAAQDYIEFVEEYLRGGNYEE